MRYDYQQVFSTSSRPKTRNRKSPRTPSAPTLAIPTFDPSIPLGFAVESKASLTAWDFLLLAIAEQYPIDQQTINMAMSGNITVADTACHTVKALIQSLCGDLCVLQIGVRIAETFEDAFGNEAYGHDEILARAGVDEDVEHLFLCTDAFRPYGVDYIRRVMKPVYDKCDTPLKKALYLTAYRLLEWANERVVSIATPSYSKRLAESHYWRGNESEIGYLAELRHEFDADEIQYYKENIPYTLADLKCSLGAIMYRPKSRVRLTHQAIRTAAQSEQDVVQTKLATAILSMAECVKRGRAIQWPGLWGLDEHLTEVACLISWQEGDDSARIFDDFHNEIYQAGCNTTNCFGISAHQIESIESARIFVEHLSTMCLELKAVNQLISALSIAEPE
jgi:hypothetical protein